MNKYLYAKIGIVGLTLVGIFVLIGIGKVTFAEGMNSLGMVTGGLLIALGLQAQSNGDKS